jgi:hypothetical protein
MPVAAPRPVLRFEPKQLSARQRALVMAAVEVDRARTWKMQCGHTTDYDVQLAYSAFRPKGKDDFCEEHGKWYKRVKVSRSTAVPPTPEF